MNPKPVFLIVSFLFALNVFAQDAFTRAAEGQTAPDFEFTGETGTTRSLSELKGKVVWITFFATWCGPCRQELPYLQREVYEKYNTRNDFELLVIGRGHTKEDLDKFRKETGVHLPFIPDSERGIFDKYASQNIPRNFIIDKTGKVASSSTGFNEEDFNRQLHRLKMLLN